MATASPRLRAPAARRVPASPPDSGLRLLMRRSAPATLRWTVDDDAPANRALQAGECRLAVLALELQPDAPVARADPWGGDWAGLTLPGWACVIEQAGASPWAVGTVVYGPLPLGTHAVMTADAGAAAPWRVCPPQQAQQLLADPALCRGPDAVEATLTRLWRDASHAQPLAEAAVVPVRDSSPAPGLPIRLSAWMRLPWPTARSRSSPRPGAT